jgi:glycosyltransferase involved in cell wall biosynthesis
MSTTTPRTPRIAGMLRIKNEARWIYRVIDAISPVCNAGVWVMDDRSTDDTVKICASHPNCHVRVSPHDKLNESRDKNWLMAIVMNNADPDWVVQIDGDEEVEAAGVQEIARLCEEGKHPAYTFQVLYLWNKENQVRADGIYSNFHRPSLFRTRGIDLRFGTTYTGNGSNLHCTNVPQALVKKAALSTVRIKHYGYLHLADRVAKYEFYNRVDPGNPLEDGYRHIVQGDIPSVPAWMQLRHAGPLMLVEYNEKRAVEVVHG